MLRAPTYREVSTYAVPSVWNAVPVLSRSQPKGDIRSSSSPTCSRSGFNNPATRCLQTGPSGDPTPPPPLPPTHAVYCLCSPRLEPLGWARRLLCSCLHLVWGLEHRRSWVRSRAIGTQPLREDRQRRVSPRGEGRVFLGRKSWEAPHPRLRSPPSPYLGDGGAPDSALRTPHPCNAPAKSQV